MFLGRKTIELALRAQWRESESFQCVFMKQRKQGLSKFRRDFVVRVKDSGSRVAVINETELFH